jgi:hypothetical protein
MNANQSEQEKREAARISFLRAVEGQRVAPGGRQMMLWPARELPNPFGEQNHYTVQEYWAESERLRSASHHVGYPAGIYGY